MRILLVGAGGVGSALARIAARRPFAELVIADYDLARAQRAAAARDGYEAVALDARDERAAAELLTAGRFFLTIFFTGTRGRGLALPLVTLFQH